MKSLSGKEIVYLQIIFLAAGIFFLSVGYLENSRFLSGIGTGFGITCTILGIHIYFFGKQSTTSVNHEDEK